MRKYVNSGKFQLLPVLLWTLIGLLAGSVVSVAYTFIAHFNPIVYLNLLAIAGMAFVMTAVVIQIVKRSRSRNKAVNLIVTFLICLFSWYIGWCAILMYVLEIPFLVSLLHPVQTVEAMFAYCEIMQWVVRGKTLPPEMLKVIYAIELLAYFIPVFLVAAKKLYYCEFCERFMKEKDYFLPETAIIANHLPEIREGDLSFLNEVQVLEDLDPIAEEQYKLNLHRCESCGERIFNFYYLKVKHKKGKAEVSQTTSVVEDIYAHRSTEE